MTIVMIGCVNWTVARGRGIQKSEIFADIICFMVPRLLCPRLSRCDGQVATRDREREREDFKLAGLCKITIHEVE